MRELLGAIARLKAGEVGELVRSRMGSFRAIGRAGGDGIFKELCFCLLTANYTSDGGIRIQRAIGDGFLSLPEKELAMELKKLGHRFPNARARYIAAARRHITTLHHLLRTEGSDLRLREWLSGNILGLGYKESSHFLRNIGREGLAIIDFHIIDVLARHNLILKPKSKSLTRKKYLEIEQVLAGIADRCGMSQGELDLYLWYLETGKVLK
jgi:N-glycosylase/DNA lyase